MTTTSTTASHGGLDRFLDRALHEFARRAWVFGGVWDPSVVTLAQDRHDRAEDRSFSARSTANSTGT